LNAADFDVRRRVVHAFELGKRDTLNRRELTSTTLSHALDCSLLVLDLELPHLEVCSCDC
jgi:hypothetical protein